MHAHAPPGAPRLEIATIFRTRGGSFRQKHRLSPWAGPWLERPLGRALLAAIEVAAVGGGGLARQSGSSMPRSPLAACAPKLQRRCAAPSRSSPTSSPSPTPACSRSATLASPSPPHRGEGQRGRGEIGGRALCAGCVRWWSGRANVNTRPGRAAKRFGEALALSRSISSPTLRFARPLQTAKS